MSYWDDVLTGKVGKGTELTKGVDMGALTNQLTQMTSAATTAGMPSFYQALQGIRERGIASGTSLGDLETSYEGDLANQFQANIASSIGAQAGNLYEQEQNRYYDLLTGERDYETGKQNAGNSLWGSLLGGLGQGAGMGLAALMGG